VEMYRGIRIATSSTSSLYGPYGNITDLLAPTLVEAPEIYPSPDGGPGGWFLAFDCSFWPTPSGWPRPPYGLARANTISGHSFTTLEGACTGNNTQNMQWPSGATHGSFMCISDAELAALESAFPSA
jgi:hypothetical protein